LIKRKIPCIRPFGVGFKYSCSIERIKGKSYELQFLTYKLNLSFVYLSQMVSIEANLIYGVSNPNFKLSGNNNQNYHSELVWKILSVVKLPDIAKMDKISDIINIEQNLKISKPDSLNWPIGRGENFQTGLYLEIIFIFQKFAEQNTQKLSFLMDLNLKELNALRTTKNLVAHEDLTKKCNYLTIEAKHSSGLEIQTTDKIDESIVDYQNRKIISEFQLKQMNK